MRVVVFGYQSWGVRTLSGLLAAGHDIPVVITHPASTHEYETIWTESVTMLARSRGIPVVECTKASCPAAINALHLAQPDLLVLSDWRTWLSPQVYGMAPLGAINIHDALLPKYGGFAPINWAIANGETETGVTVHQVTEDFDLGDILLQQRVPIGPDDTATELFERTLPLFSDLAVEAVALLAEGRARQAPQDRSQATFFHKRTTRESYIDWTRPAADIYNLIRAQSEPYPCAYTIDRGRKLEILSAARPSRAYCGTPGRVFCREQDGVVVLAGGPGGQGIVLRTVRPAGSHAQPASTYFRETGGYLGPDLPVPADVRTRAARVFA